MFQWRTIGVHGRKHTHRYEQLQKIWRLPNTLLSDCYRGQETARECKHCSAYSAGKLYDGKYQESRQLKSKIHKWEENQETSWRRVLCERLKISELIVKWRVEMGDRSLSTRSFVFLPTRFLFGPVLGFLFVVFIINRMKGMVDSNFSASMKTW